MRQFRSDDTSKWVPKYGSGSAGDVTISTNTTKSADDYAGCSGTSASTSLTIDAAGNFVNGDLVVIHQSRGTGVGNWELNKISSGGTTTSLTLTYPLTNTYTDSGASQAQIIRLIQYNNFVLNSSIYLQAPGWDGNKGGMLPILAKTSITASGTLRAIANKNSETHDDWGFGFVQGAQGSQYGNYSGYAGEGTSGAGTQSTAANGNGGGAGMTNNGSYASSGGGGGHAAAGSNGGGSGAGLGGTTAGHAELTSMVFGGAGGGGGVQNTGSGVKGAGPGGFGGGLILLISPTIDVSAATTTVVGSDGYQKFAGYSGDAPAGGGGGGAGGSILVKGLDITLGTNKLLATAGTGGAGFAGAAAGGNGAVGRIHVDYANSISGTTNPTLSSRQDTSLKAGGAGNMFLVF